MTNPDTKNACGLILPVPPVRAARAHRAVQWPVKAEPVGRPSAAPHIPFPAVLRGDVVTETPSPTDWCTGGCCALLDCALPLGASKGAQLSPHLIAPSWSLVGMRAAQDERA